MSSEKISQLNDGNPALTGDLIPIDRTGVNYSVTAQSVADLAATSSPILSATGSLTISQMANLRASPIQIIAAPGAGFFINVVSAVFNRSATAYASSAPAICLGFAASPLAYYAQTIDPSFFTVSGGVTQVTALAPFLFDGVGGIEGTPTPVSRVANLPLKVLNIGASDFAGSGSSTSLTVTVYYTITAVA